MYRIWSQNSKMTLETFVEGYLANGYIREYEALVRWDRQVLTWLERSSQGDRVILVKYEDMLLDRRKVLKRILDFAQTSYSDKILDLAVERGSFEAMRATEDKHGAESYPGDVGKRGKFVRKGKRDGWKEEMDRSIVDKIDVELAPAMKALGYLF